MLDNLRGMAVFAKVVESGSFSGAAKALGITTSAVSQQVRSLENDIGVVLLHRSTRKISLTEAGESFYQSCQEVVSAARQGRIKLSELRDELTGLIRIASTPELAVNHLIPALEDWLAKHDELSVHFEADNQLIDMIDERIDIALRITKHIDETRFYGRALTNVKQMLVASPKFIADNPNIMQPHDLAPLNLVSITLLENPKNLSLCHVNTNETQALTLKSRISTNNVNIFNNLLKEGYGIGRILDIDFKKELQRGELVPILPDWELPTFKLFAVVLKREQQPAKVVRCLDVITKHFIQLQKMKV